jgi:hypothetical protein
VPNRRYHLALTHYLLGNECAEVQQLLDRTAHVHGPSHRNDPEHTIEDLRRQLFLRGHLTYKNVMAGKIHIVVDRESTDRWKQSPLPSPVKRSWKDLTENVMAIYLEDAARRKYGR